MPTELFISYELEPVSKALVLDIKAFVEVAFPHLEVVYFQKRIQTVGVIREYMAKLTEGDCIIFLIGQEFLDSHWCMFELGLAAEKANFKNRIYPVLLPGTLLDHDRILVEVDRWTTRWETYRDAIRMQHQRNPKTVTTPLRDFGELLEHIAINCHDALDLVLHKNWLEVDNKGRLDLDTLQGFLQDWLNPLTRKKAKAVVRSAPALPPPIQMLLDDMVFVKGGAFWMGSRDDDKTANFDEKPKHEVHISDFYIGKYLVTQAQWEAVMGHNPSHFQGCPDCPVEQVSWRDCQQFLVKLNAITRHSFNLPTEAQWEYAARGGQANMTDNYQYSGGNDLNKLAWNRDNAIDKTHAVGGKEANALGLYDMSGNVWEWCRDRYNSKYYQQFKGRVAVDPLGPSLGDYFVLRGGSWFLYPQYCRVAYRNELFGEAKGSHIGLRLQRD